MRLKPRERLLLQKMASGKSLKQAGPEIGVTENTAKTMLYRIRQRLGLETHQLFYRFGQDSCEARIQSIIDLCQPKKEAAA
jgi:DNA-binding NarL/FixJ family response regulator